MIFSTKKFIYSTWDNIPKSQAVLVLGAEVKGDVLSSVLRNRVVAGVDAYKKGLATKILLSGDHGSTDNDEVNAMRKFILNNYPEVKKEDIFLDHAGFDTYDSVYRAREIFGVESMIIVTQEFHISRAVFLARSLGINAVGLSLSEENYKRKYVRLWHMREIFGRIKAFFDVINGSVPKYLGTKIPISGDGTESWDQL